MQSPIPALIVMGVSGCGKSSVGEAIARLGGGTLIEGDRYHPEANIAKMRAGIPLDDEDRAGWLQQLGEELSRAVAGGKRPVLTCSALKRKYRDMLRSAVPGLGFVFLELSRDVAGDRVAQRPGHFMPASLIDSQFATLEPPTGEPSTLVLDATVPVEALGLEAAQWWQASGSN